MLKQEEKMTALWHDVVSIDELVDGKGREFLIEGIVVAIFCDDHQYFAIDGICAHQGGPIAQGALSRDCITCPWHGWQYDIRTGCNLITQRKMLETYPTRIVNGMLQIQIDSKPSQDSDR